MNDENHAAESDAKAEPDAEPVLEESQAPADDAPTDDLDPSKLLRFLLVVGGAITPIGLFAMVSNAPLGAPSWQSGEPHAYASLLLGGPST
ncbi:MAG: hypothetical protein N2C14_20895, partial [Planctomycetales bacterium]